MSSTLFRYRWYYGLFGIIALILLCAGFLVPAIRSARQPALRATCSSYLFSIWTALRIYHADCGSYPPAYVADEEGKPKHSWRTLVLPQMGNEEVYARYNLAEPWNGPRNRELPTIIADEHQRSGFHGCCVYDCPADDDATRHGRTSYVAVIGENTLWPGGQILNVQDLPEDAKHKILLIEIPESTILWTEPRDISVKDALELFRDPRGLTNSRHPGGLHYLTFAGEVRQFSSIGSLDEFAKLLQVSAQGDKKTPVATESANVKGDR